MNSDDDIETKDRRLCSKCIGEAFLRSEIEKEGEPGTCYYCDEHGVTTSIDEMADRIETVFEQHYQPTSTEPSSMEYISMKEGCRDWERDGERVVYVICNAAIIDEAPGEDIREVLKYRHQDFERDQMGEEGPFDEETYYAEKEIDDIEYRENWRYFEKNLRTEARFFSSAAESTLESVFEGLADHKAHGGNPIIVKAGPGTEMPVLFRARVFQSVKLLEESLKRPDKTIGPPPAVSAMAGRMNARGISVFYGATDISVAIGEVRPPVGSRVAVGRFELLREVQLLDVSALRSVYMEGSIFDAGYIRQLERAKFLKRLSERITMPVMPEDEPSDYLVTQIIADYLANRDYPTLDGILYPSVQGIDGGVNVVLFRKAARVSSIEIPQGTVINVSSGNYFDESLEVDYSVWEEVPPKSSKASSRKPAHIHDFGGLNSEPFLHDNDWREATLRLDLQSLTVHHVTAARFETAPFPVRRHRLET